MGMTTMDNAGNCGTMMNALEDLLKKLNIPYHREGNRIRCFKHVLNLAVQDCLKILSFVEDILQASIATSRHTREYAADVDLDEVDRFAAELNNDALQSDVEYLEALVTTKGLNKQVVVLSE
ncbi:hypothetical protein EUX98_g4446 [Antrodiella citrinella]|uniref:HAT C-terminal dimerisation domain-containing protein n=1 Tax=Antrodiella citrinella TaxID=2447956 RepID=A0A4S4MVY6_9APHY|nr:hypothetical protein EUX98_g4446 [Antrodiella citrinella]